MKGYDKPATALWPLFPEACSSIRYRDAFANEQMDAVVGDSMNRHFNTESRPTPRQLRCHHRPILTHQSRSHHLAGGRITSHSLVVCQWSVNGNDHDDGVDGAVDGDGCDDVIKERLSSSVRPFVRASCDCNRFRRSAAQP